VTFPSEPTGQPCDRDKRRQGCAAPAGLDLDDGAGRGRMMGGRRLVAALVGEAPSGAFCFTMPSDSCGNGAWGAEMAQATGER
jgi:hypothetical protein